MAHLDCRVPNVSSEELDITDQNGVTRPVYDGLPLRTALTLMELAPVWDSGKVSATQANKTVDGLLPVFTRMNPEVTRDDLVDGFDIQDMSKIIYFLFSRVEERAGRGETETTEPEEPEDLTPADLPTPTTSRAAKTRTPKS